VAPRSIHRAYIIAHAFICNVSGLVSLMSDVPAKRSSMLTLLELVLLFDVFLGEPLLQDLEPLCSSLAARISYHFQVLSLHLSL